MTTVNTIFCDIDGCLIEHTGDITKQTSSSCKLLPGVKDKLTEWDRAGHKIILTTGRRESLRKVTEQILTDLGVCYDQLVMGLPRGNRIVINDKKPNSDSDTAFAYSPPRNTGLVNFPY